MFFAALTPLLPQYADDLGLSKAGAGLLAASYALGALVGGIPGGISAARFGVRPTVLVGLTGMAVTTVDFRVRRLDLAARHSALPAGSRELVLLDGVARVARRRRAARAPRRDDRRGDGGGDRRRALRPGARRDRVGGRTGPRVRERGGARLGARRLRPGGLPRTRQSTRSRSAGSSARSATAASSPRSGSCWCPRSSSAR